MTTRTLFFTLAFSSACAATTAEAPPASEPAVEAPALVLRVNDLPTYTVNCHVEDTVPNGLDDDCDGSIDGLPKTSALTVTWSYAPGSEVDVWMRDPSGNVVRASQEAHVSGCATDLVATSARIFANAPSTPAELVVMAKPCTAPAEGKAAEKIPVVLSLGDASGSHAYQLSLTPAEVTPLGAYVAP